MVDSVCEAEYIIALDAAKEVVYLWKFLGELGVVPALESLVPVYCDSTGAIAQDKEQSRITEPSMSCAATTLYERSWNEVTSTFGRSTKRKT